MMIKVVDLHGAASVLARTIGMSSVVLLGLILMDDRIAAMLTAKPAEVDLIVKEVGFENGQFYQRVVPTFGDSKKGNWTASISTDREFICGGTLGAGTYSARVVPEYYSADEWTGRDCSRLIDGERYWAEATWSWRHSDGSHHEVSRRFSFTYTAPPR